MSFIVVFAYFRFAVRAGVIISNATNFRIYCSRIEPYVCPGIYKHGVSYGFGAGYRANPLDKYGDINLVYCFFAWDNS